MAKYPDNPKRKARSPIVVGQRKPTDKLSGQERSDLITKLRQRGFKAATVNAIIKASSTRADIARGLAAVMTEAGKIPV